MVHSADGAAQIRPRSERFDQGIATLVLANLCTRRAARPQRHRWEELLRTERPTDAADADAFHDLRQRATDRAQSW